MVGRPGTLQQPRAPAGPGISQEGSIWLVCCSDTDPVTAQVQSQRLGTLEGLQGGSPIVTCSSVSMLVLPRAVCCHTTMIPQGHHPTCHHVGVRIHRGIWGHSFSQDGAVPSDWGCSRQCDWSLAAPKCPLKSRPVTVRPLWNGAPMC